MLMSKIRRNVLASIADKYASQGIAIVTLELFPFARDQLSS
jgi:hypothetical protein